MKKILAIHAVEGERTDIHFDGAEVTQLQTGVGKAQTAIRLTRALSQAKFDLVVNYGSAGTLTHSVGDLIVCRDFTDRDLEQVGIPGTGTPLSTSALLEKAGLCGAWTSVTPQETAFFAGHVCSTGDSFVTETGNIRGDVVDMEAYAAAQTCLLHNIPFISVKYVTDIIGQNSIRQWEEKLADARLGLKAFFSSRTLS